MASHSSVQAAYGGGRADFTVVYAAVKFGLEGWMESLRYDVEPHNIHTTIVEPGFFRTELLVDASTSWSELAIAEQDEAPLRFVAGADAIAAVEAKAKELLKQAESSPRTRR